MGECAGVVKPFLSGRQTRKHWIKASPRASLLLYLLHRDQLVCMNVHIHEKYKSKGTRCKNTAPQSSVAIHLLSLCHSPSVEPIWFIISWMELFALRSRGCAGRDEPSAPLYLIRPYFYCCCHGDIHLSAEASLNKPDNLIGRQRPDRFRLSGQHADRSARRAVPIGWRTADSGTAEDEAPLLRTDEAAAGFWLTGVIMDSGRAADTPAVILNSKYLANFFSAFLFLPSSRLWSSSGTLFGSAAHSPCV